MSARAVLSHVPDTMELCSGRQDEGLEPQESAQGASGSGRSLLSTRPVHSLLVTVALEV